MLIDTFERACEWAQRQADRRQEAYAVTRWPHESEHRVEPRTHAAEDEVLFTAEPDPRKAPRKFWPLVVVDAVALVGTAGEIARKEQELRLRADVLRRHRRHSVKVTRREVKADHASVCVLVLTCRTKPSA